jgi:hypothetical protein
VGIKAMMSEFQCRADQMGVRIHTLGDHEIDVEYTTGEPLGKMAYDSQCGIMSQNITFRRPLARDDAMPKAGKPRILDVANNDDDNTDAAIGKVLEFLENIISPDDLEIVQALICGAEDCPRGTGTTGCSSA